MAASMTTAKPPPDGSLSLSLSKELRTNIQALSLKLKSLEEKQLNSIKEEVRSKLDILDKVEETLSLEVAHDVFSVLCAISRRDRKKLVLSENEIITIEECKLAILESCRTYLSERAKAAFRLKKDSHLNSLKVKEFIPDLKLPKEREKGGKALELLTLSQLREELQLIAAKKLEKNKLTKDQLRALRNYEQQLLELPLCQQSGLAKKHQEVSKKKSVWRRLWEKIKFIVPNVIQIIGVYGVTAYVELMGEESILMLIPGISYPVALSIALGLIIVSSIMDFALCLKTFKDNFGISYFGHAAKTYLQLSADNVAITKAMNELLADDCAMFEIKSRPYKVFADIAHLANNDVTRKVANENSPFVNYKESKLLFLLRGALLIINGLAAFAGPYFMGTYFISLIPLAALGFTPLGITIITALLIGLMTACTLASLYYQYHGAIYNVLNPLADQFQAIKELGSKLVSHITQNEANFNAKYARKEQAEKLAPVLMSNPTDLSAEAGAEVASKDLLVDGGEVPNLRFFNTHDNRETDTQDKTGVLSLAASV